MGFGARGVLAALLVSVVSVCSGCFYGSYGGYGGSSMYNEMPPSRRMNIPPGEGSFYMEQRDACGRVIRREGGLWVSPEPRGIGMPRGNPSPDEIARKFREDVQRARQRARR